jgi:hypothetical protein
VRLDGAAADLREVRVPQQALDRVLGLRAGRGEEPACIGAATSSSCGEIDVTAPLVQLGVTSGHAVVVDNGLRGWLQAMQKALAGMGHDPGPVPTLAAANVKAT